LRPDLSAALAGGLVPRGIMDLAKTLRRV